MTKKLLLLCAVVMMCAGRMFAQDAWHLVADNQYYVPVSEVAYMLFTDNSEEFAVVKTDGGMIDHIALTKQTLSAHVSENDTGVAVRGDLK